VTYYIFGQKIIKFIKKTAACKNENMLRNIEEGHQEKLMAQLKKMVYGDNGINLNFINYTMDQIYRN
jgi:hypothetical protein